MGTSSGYIVMINPSWSQEQAPEAPPLPSSEVTSVQPTQPKKQQQQPIQAKPTEKTLPAKTKPASPENRVEEANAAQAETEEEAEAATTTDADEEAVEIIDERGLYKTQAGKKAGALLELAGWVWDGAPQPADDTDEYGKIVFEIKIDEMGEVIAIKTLEKTISPLVEQIYKHALTNLTFSKTADNVAYSATATGKVTFIIQAK